MSICFFNPIIMKKDPASTIYLPLPQSEKPVTLLQMAVRVLVLVVMVYEVAIVEPKANKNRLPSVPSGREKPDSTSKGTTASNSTTLAGASLVGSLTSGL